MPLCHRFTEALTHGAVPWTATDSSRRTLFYKFSPHGTSWSSSYFDEQSYEDYPDVTDRQRAILKPPSAHVWQPRKDVVGQARRQDSVPGPRL
jgi:hypothetical protein